MRFVNDVVGYRTKNLSKRAPTAENSDRPKLTNDGIVAPHISSESKTFDLKSSCRRFGNSRVSAKEGTSTMTFPPNDIERVVRFGFSKIVLAKSERRYCPKVA